MKFAVAVVLFAVVFVCSEASGRKSAGRCPANNSFGVCTYDESINCLDDAACQGGQMCCPDGCNKVCKDPEMDGTSEEPTSSLMVKHCPQPSAQFGICSYDESINCLSDDACKNGQMCCSDGCNKICKDPVTFQPKKPQPKAPVASGRKSVRRCPASNSFGVCTYDESINCLNDAACQGGQMCCSDGCNKVCKDPEMDGSSDDSEPTSSPVVKQCPQPSAQFGICSYDESINCLSDDACKNGQMCCSDGCNKICKDPVTFQQKKPQRKESAAATSGARRQGF